MKKLGTLILALGLAVAGAITPAEAQTLPPGVDYRINYYSGPGMNNLVGQFQFNCDGSSSGWGTISGYDFVEYGTC